MAVPSCGGREPGSKNASFRAATMTYRRVPDDIESRCSSGASPTAAPASARCGRRRGSRRMHSPERRSYAARRQHTSFKPAEPLVFSNQLRDWCGGARGNAACLVSTSPAWGVKAAIWPFCFGIQPRLIRCSVMTSRNWPATGSTSKPRAVGRLFFQAPVYVRRQELTASDDGMLYVRQRAVPWSFTVTLKHSVRNFQRLASSIGKQYYGWHWREGWQRSKVYSRAVHLQHIPSELKLPYFNACFTQYTKIFHRQDIHFICKALFLKCKDTTRKASFVTDNPI